MSTGRSDVHRSPRRGAATGDPLSLPIRCPQCAMEGLVGWTSLQNGIRCPSCECEFLVARGGKVVRLADMPHVRYACPRCGKSGAVPAALGARKTKCPSCALPLARGPDQRLHGESEAAELWKNAAPTPRRASAVANVLARLTTADGRWRRVNVAVAATPVVVLALMGTFALGTWIDGSPETQARRFTATCLSGNKHTPLAFVEDDAVQHVELDRWKMRHFASIVDRHRPDGDRVAIDVKALADESGHRVLAVTMRSPFLGVRNQVQYWRESEGGWYFDSRATLAREDGVTESTPVTAGRAMNARAPAGNLPRSRTARSPAVDVRPRGSTPGARPFGS